MMDDRNALFSDQTFARAIEFIWREAELLDQRDYRAWLELWDKKGLYVVPIDLNTTDYVCIDTQLCLRRSPYADLRGRSHAQDQHAGWRAASRGEGHPSDQFD